MMSIAAVNSWLRSRRILQRNARNVTGGPKNPEENKNRKKRGKTMLQTGFNILIIAIFTAAVIYAVIGCREGG